LCGNTNSICGIRRSSVACASIPAIAAACFRPKQHDTVLEETPRCLCAEIDKWGKMVKTLGLSIK
jgi:hypothetical protein